jgi:hypothetical protein
MSKLTDNRTLMQLAHASITIDECTEALQAELAGLKSIPTSYFTSLPNGATLGIALYLVRLAMAVLYQSQQLLEQTDTVNGPKVARKHLQSSQPSLPTCSSEGDEQVEFPF